jgi:hypothetical protein
MKIRDIRNRVVHGVSDSSEEDSKLALKVFKTILYDVDSMLE